MKNSRILFICIVLIVWACSPQNRLRITDKNFSEQVETIQNFTLSFNQDLMPDSLVGNWDTTAYIHFKPKIKGQFRWTTPNTLTFSPTEGLKPATAYTAIFSQNLLKHSKVKYSLPNAFAFETPQLDLQSVVAYWKVPVGDKPEPQAFFTLVFNHPVKSAEVMKFLQVKMDGKLLATENPSPSTSASLDFRIVGNLPYNKGELEGSLELLPGLLCANGTQPLKEKIVRNFLVPDITKVEILGAEALFDEGEGMVRIIASQPLVAEGIRAFINIAPAVEYELEMAENGLILRGGFVSGQQYQLSIKAGAKGVLGKTLEQDYTTELNFGEQQPYLTFADKNAMYLGLKGNRNLGVKIISIPKVKVSVFKVFENNILHYLRNGQQWDYMYENDQYYDMAGYPFDENYGKEIFSKEIATSGLSKQGDKYLLNIDPVELGLTDDLKGIYVVKVASTDKRWLSDSRLFSLTDIGLIVRKGPEQLMVFANSVLTAKPIPGVTLKFISRNNQIIHTATTNSKGVVEISDIKKAFPGFTVDMITAHLDDDFNVMVFNENFVETSRFDVGGKRTQDIPYDAFIYGQRNLYRPGDSAYFNVVVRSFAWEKASGLPLKLVVSYPSGQDFATYRKLTNPEGAASLAFAIPASAMTGIYTLNAYSGNDVLLSSARFGVEEFMPDRISVLANLKKERYQLSETVTVNVQANSLYGPPAANRRTECELSLNSTPFTSKQYPDYNFDLHFPNYIHFEPQVTETTTDEKGMASLGFELPDYAGSGLFSGKIFTTVFDENGRPVNRVNKFDYYTQDVFLGIKGYNDWVDTRKPVTVQLAAVDVQGKPALKATARVEVVYATYETVLTRYGERYSYESREKLIPITERTLSFSKGNSTLVFNPVTSGEYCIRAYLPGSSNYVQKTVWAYGYGDTRTNSFEVDREGEVSIEANKEAYQVGETAHLLFKTPFNGQLLLTVERDKVLEYHYLQTKDRAVAYDLKLSGSHVPNAYISATLIRPMDNATIPLTVAHGYKSIGIEDPATKLKVDISVADKSRSRTKQAITVKTAPKAELTLAVVDEGILQITSYKTPDPFAWFYGKRALESEPYDIYRQLFPELMNQKSSTGGDMAYDMGKRTNPLTNKRVKPAVWWIGPVKADANGNYQTHINIPGFSGALRVMAVAYNGRQFGSNAKTIHVADPIVISTALPRFLSPGDKLHLPVSLTNTTTKKANASVTLKVTGPLSVQGVKTLDVKINANAESVAEFDVTALNQIGNASVQVSVKALGETFTEDLDISVRPAAGLTRVGESGSIKAGNKLKLVSQEPLVKGTGSSFLYISKNPSGSLVRDYSYLVQYPHGCIEQSVSAVFPQLYFPEILGKIAPKTNIGFMSPEFNIKQAITKIEGLQAYNGGFKYWAGDGDINWWASVYAAHFLYEARKAGFDVSKQTTDNAIKYLKNSVKDGNYKPHRFYEHREPIYSLYVLALYGAPDYAQMNYFKANPSLLTYESAYLLAAAYAISGDRKSFEQILPKKGDFTDYNRNTGGDFSSPIRDRAIALMALVEADPDNPRIGEMANLLTKLLKKQRWTSTQEASYSFLALGKLARLAKSSNVQAKVMDNGKAVGSLKDDDLILKNLDLSRGVNLDVTGSGFLYYSWEEAGVPISGKVKEEDVNLKVRRGLYDRFGQPISGPLKAGDLVVAKITLSAQNLAVDNVAITDILPACFEIENPRLTQERGYDWIKNPSVPEYIDIRDDRINLYTSIGNYTQGKEFYYQVRVTAKGIFKQGPISADAMYDGDIRSYNGAGVIEVK